MEGGTYFVSVRRFSKTDVINLYRLLAVVTNTATIAEVEANDTAASANPLVTAGHAIGLRSAAISAGDVDYYSVEAEAGTVLYLDADADPERDGTGTDLVIELRSPADALLLTVDSSQAGSLSNPAAEGANFTITADGTHFIKVRHFNAGGEGTYHLMAVAATGRVLPGFTDSPLAAGIVVKSVHVTELRSRINDLRARFDLAPVAWSHSALVGTMVDAEDLAEMRTALQQAYVAAGRPAPAFTDPSITPQVTVIRVVHITELRSAVLELESS